MFQSFLPQNIKIIVILSCVCKFHFNHTLHLTKNWHTTSRDWKQNHIIFELELHICLYNTWILWKFIIEDHNFSLKGPFLYHRQTYYLFFKRGSICFCNLSLCYMKLSIPSNNIFSNFLGLHPCLTSLEKKRILWHYIPFYNTCTLGCFALLVMINWHKVKILIYF